MNCTLMQLYNSGESVQGDQMLKIFTMMPGKVERNILTWGSLRL